MRSSFGQIKATIAKVLNLNASDSRVIGYVNRCMERLLYDAKWVDTVTTYAVCLNNDCLTWPREIETIEAATVCNTPITIRNSWYEVIENGPGWQGGDNCGSATCGVASSLIDRGTAIAFDDITTTGYKLAVYCDGTETGQILLRYYDLNGNKIYSTVSGAREEGEYLTLPAAGGYVYSSREVLPFGWYGVIKPATNRVVRVYAYKIADASLKPLAYYEPDEEVPVYRRSLMPGLSGAGCGGDGACSTKSVIVRAKLRFIPAFNDNSILIIPHVEAIRLGCQAILKEENNLMADAVGYWAMASNCLDRQLHHHQGDGAIQPIRVEGPATWGAGVLNMI
jgi:hypothetical protein